MVKWEKKNGCVYFFKHVGLEPIKIGYSTNNDPYKRFSQFKTYAPFGAELVCFELSSMAFEAEKLLHEKFEEKRLCGEWFNISKDEIKFAVDYIKKLEELHN